MDRTLNKPTLSSGHLQGPDACSMSETSCDRPPVTCRREQRAGHAAPEGGDSTVTPQGPGPRLSGDRSACDAAGSCYGAREARWPSAPALDHQATSPSPESSPGAECAFPVLLH